MTEVPYIARPVAMIATIEAEVARLRALLEEEIGLCKKANATVDALIVERDALKATVARLEAPVSDEDSSTVSTDYFRLILPGENKDAPSCQVCGAMMMRFPFPPSGRPLSRPPLPGDGWKCLSCGKYVPDALEKQEPA